MTVVVLGGTAMQERAWDPFPPGNRLIRGATPEAFATPFTPTVGTRLGASHAPPAYITEDAMPPRRPAQDDPRLYLVETAVQQHRRRWRGPLNAVGCAGCNAPGAWPISDARLNRSQ
jgi:hypothetical protein